MKPETALPFRADINGLRAFAVLAVVAYHFGVPPFAGGFVGVDVFFVISGYLMSAIILGRMDRGSFSLSGFWLDRARRIVPALAVLVAVLLAAGWPWLLIGEYLALSRQAVAAILFASNLLFWRETGYFEPGIEDRWLLHSWSLSVEWQFYLLFPLLLILLARAPRRWLAPSLGLIALASLGLMLADDAEASFYLLPARAWELLAGSLVYLAPTLAARFTRSSQLGGLAMILAAAVLAPAGSWPGVWTLLPVAGTVLVLLAARTDSRLFANPVAARIGLDSYSIYLWHWPVHVLLVRSAHAEWYWTAGAILLSLLLGHLSRRFVERPGTRRPHVEVTPLRRDWRAHALLALPVAILALGGTAIWQARGIPQRFSPAVQAAAREGAGDFQAIVPACFARTRRIPAPCILGPGNGPPSITLLGDSHAAAQLPGLLAAAPDARIAFNAYAGCAAVLGASTVNRGSLCGEFLQRYLAPQARPRRTVLILAGIWEGYGLRASFEFPDGKPASIAGFRDNLYRSMCRLAAAGPTYAVLPTPRFPWPVTRELERRLIADPNAPDIAIPLAGQRTHDRGMAAVLHRAARDCGLRLLDPVPLLCPGGQCRGTLGHRALFRDDHHLSTYGARLLAPMFRPVLTP
ncbi:acyltransferase family protein [Sphingomonas sp. G-3-2-10]|uniref:acyltransferase family protein n=1 Tax=Sphingomonas sp. G-3-2-10 TaxID=2728838 RepID=UPI001469C31E|nr:acyltransferase family protein [Sphingomonas sp. G-3-2-10]NML06710.1 acyltransferase [Sphingomonas sp. G-3-2-10]